MTNLSKEDLASLIASVVTQVMQGQSSTPKASSKFLPRGSHAAPTDLASKDAQLVAAFARKGFKVTLMDRNNPAKPYDVRPFKGWLEQGRIVRKGSKGIRGLFHITQTDPLPSAKPAITAEQKQLFAKAKAALKAKKAKPQATLPLA